MLEKFDMWMTKIINALLVVMMLVASLTIFGNVVLRYVFESSFNGAFELVSLLMVNVTFIGASLLILDNEHLTMDAIVTFIPKKLRKVVDIIVIFIGIAFSVVLLVYSLKVMDTLAAGVTPVLQMPAYMPFLPIAIGSFITIFKFILQLVNQFKREED